MTLTNEIGEQEEIGPVGKTGRVTGPHLHLALQVDDIPRNPLLFVRHYPVRQDVPEKSVGGKPVYQDFADLYGPDPLNVPFHVVHSTFRAATTLLAVLSPALYLSLYGFYARRGWAGQLRDTVLPAAGGESP